MTNCKNILTLGVLVCASLVLGPAASAQLQQTQLPDGSTIGVPAGWQVTTANQGSLDMQGPRGEGISLGAALPVYTQSPGPYIPGYSPAVASCCDPVRSTAELAPQIEQGARAHGIPAAHLRRILEAQETQWQRGRAAYILSESELNGQTVLSYGLVAAMPTGGTQWMYYVSMVSAPEPVFRQELPLMLEVWKSWSVSSSVMRDRLDHAARSMQQTWDILRSGSSHATEVAHRCANGQDDYIRGVMTIENVRSGEQRKVPNDQAEGWVRSGEWKYVPACSTRD
jgi:hypothetical protein